MVGSCSKLPSPSMLHRPWPHPPPNALTSQIWDDLMARGSSSGVWGCFDGGVLHEISSRWKLTGF